MNRLLLFLCCICVPWMARGQAAYDWYYWFDQGHASYVRGQSFGDRFTIETDAEGLSDGIHTIHVQVAETTGKYSPPLAQLFYHTHDRTISRLHYWFDNEVMLTHSIVLPQNNYAIDVSQLKSGLHFIYFQVEDAAGLRSDVTCRAFYRKPITSDVKWSYWFDENEQSHGTMLLPNEVVMIDVSDLDEGFHVMHNQVFDDNFFDITTTMFFKVPQTEGVGNMTCICLVDGNIVANETLPTSGGLVKWDMDVNKMEMGIHKAMFQVITPSGAASSIAERYFVRAITNKELGSMKCIYTIDNFETYNEAGTLSNGLFHFDLDVASLEDGLHRIAYTLVSETGITLPQQTAFFWKTPLGGEGIVQYDYWVNENDKRKHSVQLDKHANPFNLISLLPVETQPIRSSNFQFVIKNGEPLIYARNEFHIQFYDTNGRVVEETKEYYDEQVSEQVTPVGELQATQTFPKVTDNDIRWYTMQAALGDTVAFKLSQAGTIQVFAPSGLEVFKTSESASVKWDGIHTWEDGTYYLAVHDVTGSNENMMLDYMHMDKYDVVDWDVRTVGNGGCSTITFKGNGFGDLFAVDLFTAEGDTIHSVYASHDSDAETAVTFDFTGATMGEYHAIFHFTEEDKYFSKVVTVEEAVDIELATNVSFPSTFLRGTSTTYTVKITNKGNMTAYAVPIYTYIRSKTIEGINYIKFNGLNLASYAETVGIDDFDDGDKKVILAYSETLSDDWYLTKMKIEDENNPGDSIIVRSNYFFVDIAPKSEKLLELTVSTIEDGVFAYFTIPQEWIALTGSSKTLSRSIKDKLCASEKTNKFCCIKEGVDCFGDMIAFKLDVGSAVLSVLALKYPDPRITLLAEAYSWADCVFSATNTTFKAFGDYVCNADEEHTKYEIIKEAKKHLQSIIGASLSCVAVLLTKLNKDVASAAVSVGGATVSNIKVGDILNSVSDKLFQITNPVLSDVLGTIKCAKKFIHPNSICCSGDCGGGGGSSTSVTSLDPNDIYGYLSEAGSKFIADSVAKVNYTIEFENDTAFAEASAHTIVIRDTLNNKYFDLRSFQPTGMKLGGREVFFNEAEVLNKDGVISFLKTIDVRPEINAIAQVEGTYSQQTGIAEWRFTSLDPMTMEPTDDLMQGILPVNYDGTSGIGEVMFEIGVKPNKGDGTEIPNRAGIVFDYEEAILTPTWVNTVDAVAPTSTILGGIQRTDSTLTLRLAGEDERSGMWKYNVYAQMGKGASWELVAENTTDTLVDVRIYDGIEYGFLVLATDSVGNVERKSFEEADFLLTTVTPGDANGDGTVDALDVVLVTSYYLGNNVYLNLAAADVNADGEVNSLDVVAIQNIYLNATNGGKAMGPRRRVRKLKR